MKQKISSREFYQMVKSADPSGINRLTEVYTYKLAGYLRTVHQAEPEIAADCSHQAFMKVFEKIRNGELADVENIYSYLIRTVKNEYLMTLRKTKWEVSGEKEFLEQMEGDTASDVAEALLNEEKERALRECVETLRESRQTFYKEILKYIDERDADTAKKLGMSHAGFRTRKFRLIKSLQDCVREKGF
ncbi:MAG TPA: sigma-70 family RNA polymerase sigma factor [Balneolaceae bacterium]|nr:sigma-70 family RNA polymerase sigma factor [Balneolaceae bacterium]